jgi:FkbH-like protein
MKDATKETLKYVVGGTFVTWTQTLGSPLAASGLLAASLHYSGLAAQMTPVWWLAAAPLLYILWLLLLCALSAAEMQLLYFRYEKPRHMWAIDGTPEAAPHFRLIISYLRGYLMRTLPLGTSFSYFPIVGRLYYLAYAPSCHLGRNSFFAGFMYDPDLTFIGEDAVVGGGCNLSAHNMVKKGPRNFSYISAPIILGKRVTIGGESRIAMGVTIGDDAIVEAFSNVTSMTYIPAGEVWGGNPAVFLRKRADLPVDAGEDAAAPTPQLTAQSIESDVKTAAQRVLTKALNLPADVSPEGRAASEGGEWDSLVQMAVAATLADMYDCRLVPREIVALKTLADVERILTQRSDRPAATTADAPTAMVTLPRDPEWLPLLPSAEATRLLLQSEPSAITPRTQMKIAVAAGFTAEPLASSLAAWSAAFGVVVQTEFCGYNQIAQALLSPDSPFQTNASGLNVVLLRPEDLPDDVDDAQRAAATLIAALRTFTERGGRVVVGTLPPPTSPNFTGSRAAVDALRRYWDAELESLDGVQRFEFAAVLERVGLSAAVDVAMELSARAPFSTAAYREIGIELARLVRGKRRPRAKVLALDCDNTLWGGVLGEDGCDGIQIGSDGPGRSFQAFQRLLLELKRQGVLLTLISRNEEADVLDVLERHPGMLLRRHDVVAMRVNWRPKSDNLRELATELNLGLDAFVFVDDDAAQRLLVETAVPSVHVFPLPEDPTQYAATLRKAWIFDAEKITDEDRNRTEMMQQEAARTQQRLSAADLDAYLQGLGLVVEVHEAGDRDLPRVAQLTQKTNQFNLSLRRRTLDEIRSLGSDHRLFVVSARDQFGDYGQIGVGILRHDAGEMPHVELDTFLLSCRALGRGVEDAFLHAMFEVAKRLDAPRLTAPFVEGPRNQPARDFFARTSLQQAEGRFEAESAAGYPLPKHVQLHLALQTDAAGAAS